MNWSPEVFICRLAGLCLHNVVFCVQIAVCDQVPGALFGAGTAAYALAVVDDGQVVHHVNCVMGAYLFTHLTADAADITELAECGTLLFGGAGHNNILRKGCFLDDTTGAGCGTGHTADALVVIYLGNTVHHRDGTLRTRLDTVAEAEATIGAGVGAVA